MRTRRQHERRDRVDFQLSAVGVSRLRARVTGPRRGDLVAGLTVALVLIPQSLAYAEIAGTPPVNGLYTAAVATVAGGLVGSSPYLQTGPVALTSLLTFGALAPLTQTGTTLFAAYAALLALVVGVVRVLLGALRWGVLAYLMSQPVVAAFTVAAAILILASQVPGLVDVETGSDNPFLAAGQALADPGNWDVVGIGVGLGTIAIIVVGRRLGPRFPGALLSTGLGLGLSATGVIAVTAVGDIPSGLPPLSAGLPWGTLGSLVLPGIVIALIGFAEPASIARRYAAEDRTTWNPDKEFIGQGLANIASGMFSGYPAGGSFSRSALNRLSGASTRWSGVITGLVVLAVMPVASVLSGLPKAVLSGLVIAAVLSLIQVRPFLEVWRFSRPQFVVGLVTFVATLVSAPRIERGIVLGVALSLAVHLWRELRIETDSWVDGATLHVRPHGVLYFGSAPALESEAMALIASNPDLRGVVVHLDRLGRLDLTGVLVLRSLVDDLRGGGTRVYVQGTPPQAERLVDTVLGRHHADQQDATDIREVFGSAINQRQDRPDAVTT